jgi:5-methylcytosine-specific restriction enzyme subunit McrC
MEQPRIPIANLYYLLCYSWNQLEQGELIDVSKCPSTELVDLFALVLYTGVNHLARRGLEQGYEAHLDELSSPRGRIDALSSARRFLTVHGRAACQFDELTANTLNNQVIKSTLRLLCQSRELHPSLRPTVTKAYRSLLGIASPTLTAQSFRKVQLHSNTRFYRFLLNVCELVFRSALPNTSSGEVRFRDFVRDERAMARVFENFLFNFIKREARGVTVKRDRIGWDAASDSDPALLMLPSMNTDISVYSISGRLIIDAKYYSSSVSFFRDSTKYHSANLYQLMSYLTNAQSQEAEIVRGMLIYPRVDRTLRDSYIVQGHPLTIATVDLSRDWPLIRTELLEVLETAGASAYT